MKNINNIKLIKGYFILLYVKNIINTNKQINNLLKTNILFIIKISSKICNYVYSRIDYTYIYKFNLLFKIKNLLKNLNYFNILKIKFLKFSIYNKILIFAIFFRITEILLYSIKIKLPSLYIRLYKVSIILLFIFKIFLSTKVNKILKIIKNY